MVKFVTYYGISWKIVNNRKSCEKSDSGRAQAEMTVSDGV